MDDLLDLNWTSSSTTTTTINNNKAIKNSAPLSAFDSLARVGSPNTSNANYYSASSISSSSNAIQPARAVSPSFISGGSQSLSKSNDAFSSLFDSGNNSGARANTSSMTMQQRLDMQRGGAIDTNSGQMQVLFDRR